MLEANDKKRETAAYIEDLVRELQSIAKNQNLEMLAEILGLAREEARRVIVRKEPIAKSA